MSSIGELEAEISECSRQIEICENDIREMREYIIRVQNKKNTISESVYFPTTSYDISSGSEWIGFLEQTGEEKKRTTAQGVVNGINGCLVLINCIENAIREAQERIAGFRQRISACQSEIEAIREEERKRAEKSRGRSVIFQ